MSKRVLSQEAFNKASHFLLHSTRAVERSAYNCHFEGAEGDKLLLELGNYQNPDGGFGHGLEPDLRLPYSSPFTTSVAFRHLGHLDENKRRGKLSENGINYFEKTFCRDKERWFAVPKKVNDYPHAPWWHYSGNGERTAADNNWGNPSAEITAYLLRYKDFVQEIDLTELVKTAVRKLNNKREFHSEHEIFCYLKLYYALPSKWAKKIEDKLYTAIQNLVCSNPDKWDNYVPQPLHFVDSPDSQRFGISESLIEENLEFWIEMLEQEGVLKPSWKWDQYEKEWERAKSEWTGILTLKALTTLDKFNRIT